MVTPIAGDLCEWATDPFSLTGKVTLTLTLTLPVTLTLTLTLPVTLTLNLIPTLN